MLVVLLALTAEVLTLPEAVARAQSHPRLAVAQATASAATAQIGEARAGWLPSANVALSGAVGTANFSPQPGLSLSDDPLSGAAHRYYGAVASATQPLWDFGRTSGQVKAARTSARAAESEVAVTRADVELAVTVAFYEVLAAGSLKSVAAEAVATMGKHLTAATALVRAGKRPPFDVTKARIDLANAKVALLDAEAALVQARLGLAAAVGSTDLPETLATPALATSDPDERTVMARARRPELTALEARLAAARAQVDAQRSAFLPVLSAAGLASVRGIDRGAPSPATNWQVGIQLNIPLLAGGADLARLHLQQAMLRALQSAHDDLTLQITVEARQLVSAVASARARHEAAAAIARAAHENLEIAEQRYSAGLGTIIELADARQTLTAAESQNARAQYDLAKARAHRDR